MIHHRPCTPQQVLLLPWGQRVVTQLLQSSRWRGQPAFFRHTLVTSLNGTRTARFVRTSYVVLLAGSANEERRLDIAELLLSIRSKRRPSRRARHTTTTTTTTIRSVPFSVSTPPTTADPPFFPASPLDSCKISRVVRRHRHTTPPPGPSPYPPRRRLAPRRLLRSNPRFPTAPATTPAVAITLHIPKRCSGLPRRRP